MKPIGITKPNQCLLKESTSFEFSGTEYQRVIDRTTTLIAQEKVLFADIKDGFLGLRVAHELELPVLESKNTQMLVGL